MILGVAELARAFGCSDESIRLWTINEGLPCLQRGLPGVEARYPLPECIAWLVERARRKEAENPASTRAQYLGERLQRERMRRLKEAGDLVGREATERAAYAVARVVRDALLSMPDRLAARLAAELDPARVHADLDMEIRQALAALADGLPAALASPPQPADDAQDDAAT